MPQMKAVQYDSPGDPEVLKIEETDVPEPGLGEVLLEVHASALNRADTFQRRGNYPPPEGASPILGLEAAGVVADVGEGVQGWNPGERAFTLLAGGGYAEYVSVPQNLLMSIPPGMSTTEAAAVPEVFLTAYQALYWLGDVESADHVLIHAGGSGVGTAAIQLAREAGATVHITASAPKHEICRELGAETAIDYEREDFAKRIGEVTEGAGVDLIIDFIGAPYFDDNIRALAVDGTLVVLATLGGSKVSEMDLRTLFTKRVHLITSTLRSRSNEYKRELTQDFAGYALPLFLDGTLRPVIDKVYDWTDVAEAHRRMEANENAGKIVLRVKAAAPTDHNIQ